MTKLYEVKQIILRERKQREGAEADKAGMKERKIKKNRKSNARGK